MTRANLDNNRARGLLFDGPQLFIPESLAILANFVMVAGMPYMVALDPANTGRNVTMYTPVVTSYGHKHEIVNISVGTGTLTIKDPTGATTLAVVAPGQRAEVNWDVKSQAWLAYLSTNGQTNTVGGQSVLQQYTLLASLANAMVMSMAIPFAFKLLSVGFRTRVAASTAAKLATLTGQVNGVSVTGGVVSLTTANQNTSGGLTAGTSITAGNVGAAGQSIGVLVSAVTAFVEGDGYVEYVVQNTSLPA